MESRHEVGLRCRKGRIPLVRGPLKDGKMSLDCEDRADFEYADRGFIGTLDPMVIAAADGRVVWDMGWDYVAGDCPETVNPSRNYSGP
jgi:alkyl sulfatase BDS1-like metallo-beta-lactamase superfamily hydrolase